MRVKGKVVNHLCQLPNPGMTCVQSSVARQIYLRKRKRKWWLKDTYRRLEQRVIKIQVFNMIRKQYESNSSKISRF